MNLNSNDPLERISSITTLVVCCLTIVGLIFFLAAIPTHLHYLQKEQQLADLYKTKASLERALANGDAYLKQQFVRLHPERALDGEVRRASVQYDPHGHDTLHRTSGRRHLDEAAARRASIPQPEVLALGAEPAPLSTLPTFADFLARVSKLPHCTPKSARFYTSNGETREGKTVDVRIIENIKTKATSALTEFAANPALFYGFEKANEMSNGFILHVLEKRGGAAYNHLQIWYPDPSERQNLAKYHILEVNLIDGTEHERLVTLNDVNKIYQYLRHHRDPAAVVLGTTPIPPLAGAPASTAAGVGGNITRGV